MRAMMMREEREEREDRVLMLLWSMAILES